MFEYLFVYGTLLSGAPEPAVNRMLHGHCEDVGAASVGGRLYRLGWYPGLVPDPNAQNRVTGRLLRILAPDRCWPVLDAYEGYRPQAPGRSEFVRTRIKVRREPGGETIEAWTYVYNGPLRRAQRIHRWPPPLGDGSQSR
jgi:gamma-glutamylcyclotransferase (GGCT)/AIG2-like uncharacterized protein YtfP